MDIKSILFLAFEISQALVPLIYDLLAILRRYNGSDIKSGSILREKLFAFLTTMRDEYNTNGFRHDTDEVV